jgi:hypothetical protein
VPARRRRPADPAADAVAQKISDAMAAMPPAERHEFLQLIMTEIAGRAAATRPPDPPTRPDLRRPRRDTPATLRVRADLRDARPPIWRRLDIASDAHLDEVHRVLQTAFGWTDSHLHRFSIGGSPFDLSSAVYLCPFDVEEGDEGEGVDERLVRLDELVVEPGDRLFYVYDYGDGWDHVLRLESVRDRSPDEPRAVAIDGRRAGPPEDCGGMGGYEELLEAGAVDGAAFDLAAVNAALAHVGASPSLLLGGPGLDEFARRLSWLLDRIGEDGITLTAAGYLPPAVVREAFDAWHLEREWIGAGNREDQTYPVMEVRQEAHDLRLVRRYKGRLLLTTLGRQLRGDEAAMKRLL